MKLGVQSISWGERIVDIEAFASSVRRIGFDGVEFSQKSRYLPEITKLLEIFSQHSLEIAGLCGGGLKDRIAYVGAAKGTYLYADEWCPRRIAEISSLGFRVSLHPHCYKTIASGAAAVSLIRDNPHLNLGLIIDTAHCFLAGESVSTLIKENLDVVDAVHLKDWCPDYGRSPYRFARGFTSLGKGILRDQISDTLDLLKSHQFSGWVIVEQDTPSVSAEQSAADSLEWVRKVLS